jgi:aminoglycoside phosphotransferase (APT) family kinase protein
MFMASTVPENTVTVNAVIVGPEETRRLVELLRAEPGFERAELAGPPQPLTDGFWASMSLLRLTHVAPSADTLVLRVMPDPVLAAKETVFQREIGRQGFPVPAVRLAGGTSAGVGGAFLLMDYAPGAPLLGGLGGIAALRCLPVLAHQLPALLGRVTAGLHALDPAPLRAALAEADVAAPSDAPALVAALAESAGRLGRADLSAAARWLAGHPAAGRAVIGHGDLHPFNLLIHGERWTLLDWTSALVADPAYDLAFTTLTLRHPPLAAPAPLRPVICVAGAALARRFLAAYRRGGGTVPDQRALDWYTSLHALRILIELDGWRHDPDGPGRSFHPWMAMGPVAAQILTRTMKAKVSLAAT